jgi:hypothetical protein
MGTHFFANQHRTVGVIHTVEVTGSNPVLPIQSVGKHWPFLGLAKVRFEAAPRGAF